jgi:hypothetical protein
MPDVKAVRKPGDGLGRRPGSIRWRDILGSLLPRIAPARRGHVLKEVLAAHDAAWRLRAPPHVLRPPDVFISYLHEDDAG